jgi:hypothetical protein
LIFGEKVQLFSDRQSAAPLLFSEKVVVILAKPQGIIAKSAALGYLA